SGADGGEPYKGVTLDRECNLYGTAVAGGSGSCEGGCGVVYKLTNSGGTWTQTVIHAFTGGNDGSGPGARVTVDPNGNVYGMTPTGGAYGLHHLQNPSRTQWNLDIQCHSRFYRRRGRSHGLSWKDDSAQWPPLWRSYRRRHLWKRSYF